ncbi:MAG: hypothetical protein FJ126_01375 [Deltaproteobacteria bacterium]|nr:hypothetical protein [Deltaproteobacteria bacterium]
MDKRRLVREMLKRFDQPHLEKVLAVLNSLVTRGLLSGYAISGSFAALYYAQPILTYDLDVCCLFPPSGPLADLSPLYAHLRSLGYEPQGEYVPMEGIPVQFISAAPGSLSAEAVATAREVVYRGAPTRIVRLEYLLAIMAELARPRDIAKLAVLLEEAAFDAAALNLILAAHGLTQRWAAIRRRIHEPLV